MLDAVQHWQRFRGKLSRRRNDVWRLLVKSYIVYYLIDNENEKIVILRFVYSGRNQDKIVKEF